MTPSDLQQLLITRAPRIPGIADADRRSDDSPYGLTVTLDSGGQVWWTITGAGGAAPTQAVSGNAGEETQLPDLTGRPVAVALVEQALVAAATAGDASSDVVRVDRYSTRPDPPAVRYGATLECRDGWKLFLSCYGTVHPGAAHPEQPYQPLSHI
ncbi:hypothetical protein [Kitasatospora sp. NBC_01302]|uniref:hypothetical protein n=1 Tax=Kitasatospora sp. NBC_01302 TaxID=2903575 RepID=UPI002E12E092|nr:hypothetical protein OG294_37835 [Kitasatospora sp. NBC_01302]